MRGEPHARGIEGYDHNETDLLDCIIHSNIYSFY